MVSAGPNRDQAQAHLVDGTLDQSGATLQLRAPRHIETIPKPPEPVVYQAARDRHNFNTHEIRESVLSSERRHRYNNYYSLPV